MPGVVEQFQRQSMFPITIIVAWHSEGVGKNENESKSVGKVKSPLHP